MRLHRLRRRRHFFAGLDWLSGSGILIHVYRSRVESQKLPTASPRRRELKPPAACRRWRPRRRRREMSKPSFFELFLKIQSSKAAEGRQAPVGFRFKAVFGVSGADFDRGYGGFTPLSLAALFRRSCRNFRPERPDGRRERHHFMVLLCCCLLLHQFENL